MRAKPRTTYVAASPQTWELIRAAYLSGLSGPTVAARFGVSVTALRKRAAKEGWTKQAYARASGAAAQGPAAGPSAGPAAFAPQPPLSPEAEIALKVEAVTARQIQPLYEEPEEMARRALGMAARAISEGDGLAAARLVRSARELRELDGVLPVATYWDTEELKDVDGRREHMRVMVRSLALRLAEMIVAGTPLPAEFEGLRAERAEDLA